MAEHLEKRTELKNLKLKCTWPLFFLLQLTEKKYFTFFRYTMYMYAVLYQGGGCGKQIAREGGVKIILTWNDVQKHGIMFKRKSQLMQYR